MAANADFPFNIMDVAYLLRLNIRRRGGTRVVYTDCPLCGDRRGKMALYPEINTWHCYHCGKYGGMLPLYGQVYGISNSAAYQEICEALGTGATPPEYQVKQELKDTEVPKRASAQEIDRTLTALLKLLTLRPAHREHLRSKRGLSDEQIRQFGFKSTPMSYECRSIAHRLAEFGYTVEGVPGFYLDDQGRLTMKFFTRTSGIIIPLRDVDGLLQGLQIRLDHPIKNKDDPPEKKGIKYLPFTSTGKPMGVTSGNPIHFIGDPNARVVYVTEGALKADIAHALTGRTFAATVGVNNTMGMDELFSFLHRNGTEEIIEAEDMDKYSNPNVARGASKVHQLAIKNGMACRRLIWNPNHKGIDDWLLALRAKELQKKEQVHMDHATEYRPEMCRTQRYRVYQLDLQGIQAHPFAFRSMETMFKAGYQQPPAGSYQLVFDGELTCPKEQGDKTTLEQIFGKCNDNLPEGYQGHSLSMSDVVELYDGESRSFFYCDEDQFSPVAFDDRQAKPMQEVGKDA